MYILFTVRFVEDGVAEIEASPILPLPVPYITIRRSSFFHNKQQNFAIHSTRLLKLKEIHCGRDTSYYSM